MKVATFIKNDASEITGEHILVLSANESRLLSEIVREYAEKPMRNSARRRLAKQLAEDFENVACY